MWSSPPVTRDKTYYIYVFEGILSLNQRGASPLGSSNQDFLDFYSSYFYLAFIKEVHHLAKTVFSELFALYYPSSWAFLNLVLFQLVAVLNELIFHIPRVDVTRCVLHFLAGLSMSVRRACDFDVPRGWSFSCSSKWILARSLLPCYVAVSLEAFFARLTSLSWLNLLLSFVHYRKSLGASRR